jgi:hypothetical protein
MVTPRGVFRRSMTRGTPADLRVYHVPCLTKAGPSSTRLRPYFPPPDQKLAGSEGTRQFFVAYVRPRRAVAGRAADPDQPRS